VHDAALAADDAFERESDEADDGEGGYRVTTATFDATVVPGPDRYRVVVEAPTIGAAVVGEEVADVVVEGWYETLERRLSALGDVTTTDDVAEPTVRRAGETVVVEVTYDPSADAAGDALALVNFVEGTWFQGLIPGYAYEERVAAAREAARQRGGTD